MSSRQNNDLSSASGFSYSAGAASQSGTLVRNIAESKSQDASSNSALAKRWPNTLEVWADGSVFDTLAGQYLQPGKDFLIGELQRR
jgi:hypothetical protein